MSSTNGSNSTASNRTSIFETFNSSTFDADADDFVVINHNVKPVKSVVRRSFDHAPDPAPDVEGFEEILGQETDDVECIEEEEENQHDMLFMSCSPGRISTDDDENDGQLIFTKEAPKKKKKKPTVAKQVERPKSQKQTKHSVKEPKKRQKRQEEESEEEVMEEPDDEEWTQEKYELKKHRRRQQRKEEEEDEEEEEESVQHQAVKESKKQKPKQDDQQEDLKEPQKALSAYALFYRDTQSAIKSQNAKATFGEVSKIVAKMWDNLDQGHKKVYEKQAEEDKETYLQEMVQYRQACRAQQKNLEAQKKDKTAHLRPYVAHHKPSWSKSSLDADNEENSWSSHESGDRSAEVVVKKSVLALCNRSNCPNRAVEDPRWNKDYCSTECVISHCRDVFTAWVSSRHSIYKSDKSDT